MPKNAKTVRLVPTGPDGWQQPGKIVLDPNSGAHLIRFELSGNHQGITFDPAEPIWVKANQKPTQMSEDAQIPAFLPSQDGKELIILDLNSNSADEGPLELHYQLNFVGRGPLDPIIENGGGPKLVQQTDGDTGLIGGADQNFLSTASPALIIGLAVLIFIVGGVVGRLTR